MKTLLFPICVVNRNCFFAAFCIFITCFLILSGCKDETTVTTAPPDELTNPAVQPKLLFSLPGDNSTGPFELFNKPENYNSPHAVLRFNKLMNLTALDLDLITVKGFDRPVRVDLFREPFYYHKRGRPLVPANSQFDDVVSLSIKDSLFSSPSLYRVGTTYTITLAPGLEDVNGNKTTEQYRFTFLPEPYFRVIEIYPESKAEGISNTQPIEIFFNSKIDTSILPSLRLTPRLDGQWKIFDFDSSTIVFQKFDFFPFDSSYTVTVDSTARDRFGNMVRQAEVSSFRVAPFKVSSTDPVDGKANVDLDAGVWISFTGVVDTTSLTSSFAISPALPGRFINYTGTTTFLPTAGFTPSTTYVVTVNRNLHAYNGMPLPNPYSFSFTTSPFNVRYTYPSDGDYNVLRSAAINVNANAKLDTGSVRSAVTIAPAIEGIFILNDDNSSFGFTPISTLAPNTVYTVTLSTGFRTKNGYALPKPFSFRFKTGQ